METPVPCPPLGLQSAPLPCTPEKQTTGQKCTLGYIAQDLARRRRPTLVK